MAKIDTSNFLEDLNDFEPRIDRIIYSKNIQIFLKSKKLEIDNDVLEKHHLQLLSTLAMLALTINR